MSKPSDDRADLSASLQSQSANPTRHLLLLLLLWFPMRTCSLSAGEGAFLDVDGNPNTALVKDIWPGPNGSLSFARFFFASNGKLFFETQTGDDEYGFWRSDGTAAETVRIPGVSSARRPTAAVLSGNTLFFGGYDATNTTNVQLWKSDGTELGTVVAKSFSDAGEIPSLVGVNGGVMFTVASRRLELWKSDGTEAGTVRVKDIEEGDAWMLAAGDGMVFFSTQHTNGSVLWKSDGTEAGTVKVKQFREEIECFVPGPGVVVNGILFFSASGQLWKSDGTETGTVRVKDIQLFSSPHYFVVLDERLFFLAFDESGTALWRSDGTEAGTMPVFGSQSSFGLQYLSRLISVDGFLYFWAGHESRGIELCRSDGTEAGTRRITNMQGRDGGLPPFAIMKGNLFFPGVIQDADPNAGIELIRVRVMPLLEEISVKNGKASGEVFGVIGQRHVIQGSQDLVNWRNLTVVTNLSTQAPFQVPLADEGQQFFRAMVAP